MVFDLREHEAQIDKTIAKNFRRPLMSNSKWRKVFSALDSSDLIMKQGILKLVSSGREHRTWTPKNTDLEDQWVSEGKGHYHYFYMEIEWIEFPRIGKPYGKENIPHAHYRQTIEEAREIIESIGILKIDETPLGCRLYGYETYRNPLKTLVPGAGIEPARG